MFWGAFDVEYAMPAYGATEHVSGGASAAAGSGVGVRRAQLSFTRTPPGTFDDDVAEMHFDFLNFTGGTPDDTWNAGDYAQMDTNLGNWWTSMQNLVTTRYKLREIRWYRVGTGVVPPNPPEHIHVIDTAGTATGIELPPQVACSISLHTAQRKNWGRTYLPGLVASSVDTGGVFDSTTVHSIAQHTDDLVNAAASNDFGLVVLSKVAGSALTVEHIDVDNVVDIIRRRRWRNPTYRATFPA